MAGGKCRDTPKIPFEVGTTLAVKNKNTPSTKKAARLVMDTIGYQNQEYAVVITTDLQFGVLAIRVVGIGDHYEVTTNTRDLMRGAIVDGAFGVVFIHNHPVGSMKASKSDKRVISALKKAGKILDVRVLDAIIVHKNKWVSVI